FHGVLTPWCGARRGGADVGPRCAGGAASVWLLQRKNFRASSASFTGTIMRVCLMLLIALLGSQATRAGAAANRTRSFPFVLTSQRDIAPGNLVFDWGCAGSVDLILGKLMQHRSTPSMDWTPSLSA